MTDPGHLLSVHDVAARLGVTRQRVHALIRGGQLRAVRLGRYHYIEAGEVERYLALPEGKPYARRTTSHNSIDK